MNNFLEFLLHFIEPEVEFVSNRPYYRQSSSEVLELQKNEDGVYEYKRERKEERR